MLGLQKINLIKIEHDVELYQIKHSGYDFEEVEQRVFGPVLLGTYFI